MCSAPYDAALGEPGWHYNDFVSDGGAIMSKLPAIPLRTLLIATTLLMALLPPVLRAATPLPNEDTRANAPALPLLEARVKQFWQAVGAHDIVTRYEMTTPTVRALVTLEAFKKTWSWEEQPQFPLQ